MMNKKKDQNLQLYLHIPFCVQKCAYCDFLSGPATTQEIDRYVEAMIGEIVSYRQQFSEYEVSTVFLGGGTPSILTEVQMEGVFLELYDSFRIRSDAEITIEMNPGTVTEEKLRTYKKVGINRLSIGLQSVHNEELKLLGRIHTMEAFLLTYQMARRVGFHNINVDLISAIPGQTPASWLDTLQTVVDLDPEHISAYSLIVEEGTPFYEKYGDEQHLDEEECDMRTCDDSEHILRLPDEEEERIIYKDTNKFLNKHNYERYEISNYAKPGYACRHNKGYWQRENYLGIGVGASSFIDNRRFSHITDQKEYIELVKAGCFDKLVADSESLSEQAQMEEFMFLGLREIAGVQKERFLHIFGKTIEEVYGDCLQRLKHEKLVIEDDASIRLTEYGIDISNYVMSQFLLS